MAPRHAWIALQVLSRKLCCTSQKSATIGKASVSAKPSIQITLKYVAISFCGCELSHQYKPLTTLRLITTHPCFECPSSHVPGGSIISRLRAPLKIRPQFLSSPRGFITLHNRASLAVERYSGISANLLFPSRIREIEDFGCFVRQIDTDNSGILMLALHSMFPHDHN